MKQNVILTLALMALLAGPAAAQWQDDGAAISTVIGAQNTVNTAPDGYGGVLVTWADARSGVNDIYAQRVNPNGTGKWTANGVAVCISPNVQSAPKIISDGTGGAIITWYDTRSGVSNDIYAQRFNTNGAAQWAANGLAICDTVNSQTSPTIVSDGAGGAIIAWADGRSGNNDIYAQRVNASGAAQWTSNGVAICTATGDQEDLAIVGCGDGGAIMIWKDERDGASDAEIYAQRVNASGVVAWTANGAAVCTTSYTQNNIAAVSDGSNGAIITWQDYRSNGNYDNYAQRVDINGTMQWSVNGNAISTASNSQFWPCIASDGTGGAIIAWIDSRTSIVSPDIYAQRVNYGGTCLWPANGVAISTATGYQGLPKAASDGDGGAIITWYDERNGSTSDEIFAQRVNTSGARQWNTHSGSDSLNGVAICLATDTQNNPTIVSDGAGGAYIAWEDQRSYFDDIYAQRIGHDGLFSEPEMVSVSDVPNDQGGLVNVIWAPSGIDAYPDTTIAYYSIWRSLTGLGLSDLQARGGRRIEPSDVDENFQGQGYRITERDGKAYAWEWLTNLTWHHYLTQWSYLAPTTCDSGPGGRVRNHYMISAQTDNPIIYWDSDPDSGYSVDNLPPSKSLLLVGQLVKGSKAPVRLDWNREIVADFWRYGVYRCKRSGFLVADSLRIGYATDTTYNDNPTDEPFYYKVAAQDIHGNEGTPSNEWYYNGSTSISLSMLTAAELEDGRVVLRWRTESEENCLRWDIERARSDLTYAAIGSVAGQGTTSQPTEYRYTDETELTPGMYYYRLCQMDLDGSVNYYGPISVNYVRHVPLIDGLAESRPNPFDRQTVVSYQLATAKDISIGVYNVYGQLVRLLDEGIRQQGYHRIKWDGRNRQGQQVSAGVYLVRLEGAGVSASKKLVIVR